MEVVEHKQQEAAEKATLKKMASGAREARVKAKKARLARPPSVPQAVITASPKKGYSPLTVHFSGTKSRSAHSKIIAYSWDFGDGDTSSKPNPVNTYYSGSVEPKYFSVVLTVTDDNGNTATSTMAVEVLNK
jgi:PKD repeat protein